MEVLTETWVKRSALVNKDLSLLSWKSQAASVSWLTHDQVATLQTSFITETTVCDTGTHIVVIKQNVVLQFICVQCIIATKFAEGYWPIMLYRANNPENSATAPSYFLELLVRLTFRMLIHEHVDTCIQGMSNVSNLLSWLTFWIQKAPN